MALLSLVVLSLLLLLQQGRVSGGEYTNGLDSQVRPDRAYIQRSRNIHVAVTIDRNSIGQFLFPLYSAVKTAVNPSKVVVSTRSHPSLAFAIFSVVEVCAVLNLLSHTVTNHFCSVLPYPLRCMLWLVALTWQMQKTSLRRPTQPSKTAWKTRAGK